MKSQKFTLIELLVVTSLLLLTVSLISPTMKNIFQHTENTECKMHLRSISRVMELYTDDNYGVLPGACHRHPRAIFRSTIKYDFNGKRSTRDKNFASYISPYLNLIKLDTKNINSTDTQNLITKGYDFYLKELLCPTNSSMTTLGEDPRIRPQYFFTKYADKAISIQKINPFGSISSVENKPDIEPLHMNQISNPSKVTILREKNNSAEGRTRVDRPDLPVHAQLLENHVYFDGRVITLEGL